MANIGKLALTVTANAAPALKDLDSFEKKTKATGKAVESVAAKTESAGGSGGLFAAFAGAAGGAAVLGLQAIGKALGSVLGLVGSVEAEAAKLGYRFSNMDAAGIRKANLALNNVRGSLLQTLGTALAAAEPAITKIASLFVTMMEKATPAIVWLTDKVGDALVYAFRLLAGVVEIAAVQLDSLWAAFERGGGFSREWLDMAKMAKAVLKGIMIGLGYVFDAWKAGWGGVLAGLGKVLELTGEIGERAGVGWASDLRKFGASAKEMGKEMFFGFGRTHDQINDLFDGLDKRADGLGKNLRQAMAAYAPSAALLAGSTQEYSVRAKFDMDSKLNPQIDVQKQMVKKQEAANEILKRMQDELREIRLGLNFEVL